MRFLTLLRHAKAVESADGLDDHDRALAPTGREAAQAVGAACRDRPAQLVLTSPARRTVETTELVARFWTPPPEIARRPALYLASETALLSEIRGAPDDVIDLWLVGHNPGLGALARMLALRGEGHTRFPALSFGFPTGSRATFKSEAESWLEIDTAPLTLTFFGRAGGVKA